MEWLEKHANVLAGFGVVMLVATFAYRNQLFRDTVRYTIQQIALMPIFFLIILPDKSWITRALEGRWLRHLGHLSYSMYLIHHTLFHHFYHLLRPSFWLVLTIFILSVAYAQAMRTFVELPIQRWRERNRKRLTVVVSRRSMPSVRVAG